jgi:uncharacterized membrane protein
MLLEYLKILKKAFSELSIPDKVLTYIFIPFANVIAWINSVEDLRLWLGIFVSGLTAIWLILRICISIKGFSNKIKEKDKNNYGIK